jgi:RHS repeat-associated protein
VTVNSLTADRYTDLTYARTNFPLVDATTNFTAIAGTSNGLWDTNTVTVDLRATNTFAYDLNGNLLSDGKRGFDYDDESQLVRITVTNAWKAELTYDGKHRRRIRKEFAWQGGAWTQTNEVRYFYEGSQVIQERDGGNAPKVTYTRTGLSLLSRTDNSASTHAYYHADGNLNVTALVNGSQLLVAKYLYDPFGRMLSQSGPLAEANVYQFSSQEFHGPSGLTLYLRRAYDPSLQRFINRDPLGEDGGINLFGFVGNNPINSIDLFGLAELTFWQNFWLGAGNDFGKVMNGVADIGRVAVDTVGMAAYSLNGNPEDFQPWSMTYKKAFCQDADMLQADILMGTFKMALNIPTLGYEYLWEGTYAAADTGDFSQLQNAFAGYAIGFGIAKLKSSAPTQPKPLVDQAAELIPLNGGKNRVTLRSENFQMDVDLAGAAHNGIPTPHTKISPRNFQAPESLQPAYNTSYKKATVSPATQQDIRTVRRYLERQK